MGSRNKLSVMWKRIITEGVAIPFSFDSLWGELSADFEPQYVVFDDNP